MGVPIIIILFSLSATETCGEEKSKKMRIIIVEKRVNPIYFVFPCPNRV